MHVPDRVLRQFGVLQHIPINAETIRRVTSCGRPDENWVAFHAAHIERWSERLNYIFYQLPVAGDDPLQAASIYMQWYWTIIWRWIYRLVQRSLVTFQPRRHIERALVDAQQQTNYSIRQLVNDPPSTLVILETLTSIGRHIDMILENVSILSAVRDSGGSRLCSRIYIESSGVTIFISSHSGPYDISFHFRVAPAASITNLFCFDVFTSSYLIIIATLVSTSAAFEDHRPQPLKIQEISEHDEGAIIENLDQLAVIEPLDNIPIIELAVPRGRGRG